MFQNLNPTSYLPFILCRLAPPTWHTSFSPRHLLYALHYRTLPQLQETSPPATSCSAQTSPWKRRSHRMWRESNEVKWEIELCRYLGKGPGMPRAPSPRCWGVSPDAQGTSHSWSGPALQPPPPHSHWACSTLWPRNLLVPPTGCGQMVTMTTKNERNNNFWVSTSAVLKKCLKTFSTSGASLKGLNIATCEKILSIFISWNITLHSSLAMSRTV